MSDQDTDGRGFNRPWEEEDDAAEVVPLPGVSDEDVESAQSDETDDEPEASDDTAEEEVFSADEDDELDDWETLASARGSLSDYSDEEYLAASTREYQGLAEEVSRAAEEDWQQQAVAASMPGVGTGLVGFEDVSGAHTAGEESFEAMEQAAASDLAMRVGSGLAIFGLFMGSLVLGGWWFTTFVVLVMMVAVGELYATMRMGGYKPLALFGLIGVAMIGFGTHAWGVMAIAGWAALMSLVTLLFVSLTPRRNPLEDSSVTILGMAWVGMLAFAIPFGAATHPVAFVFFIVVLVAFNDMGAYFVGRALGKSLLTPKLSPNKSVEGLVGGLIIGAMVASVMVTFPYWEPIGLTRGLVMAAIVGVLAPMGDLVESMIKRSLGVKDMGSVLPGHGGMIDRIDSFLLTVPALYFVFRAFELL